MNSFRGFGGKADFFEKAFSADSGPAFMQGLFTALMSPEEKDLDEVVDEMEKTVDRRKMLRAALSDDVRYEIKELRSFRKYYGRRQADYTPEQRELLHAYDKNWTEDIVRRLLGHKSEVLDEDPPALNVG